MPNRSRNRSLDHMQIAKRVVEEATGQRPKTPPSGDEPDTRDPAAVALGKLGGKKGGAARAAKLSPKRRSQLARKRLAVAMNPELHSQVLRAATAIHSACARESGGSKGNCREATFALALALQHLPWVALSQGTVLVGGMEHDHFWCRIERFIVDPTADQFGAEAPLIAEEWSLAHYKEQSYFLFSPTGVARLARAVGVVFPSSGSGATNTGTSRKP